MEKNKREILSEKLKDPEFKKAFIEKLEDEYDLAMAEKAYAEFVNSGCKATPAADFWRELDAEV